MRLRRIVASLGGVLFLTVTAAIAGLYGWANGATAGALALATLPATAALALAGAFRPRFRRTALLGIALLLACDVAWTSARIARPAGEGLRVCVNAQCDGRGAFWQRVPDEREAARAGLYLSALGGSVRGEELRAFDALLDVEYARVPPGWRGLPNALLMSSSPTRIETHRWIPPGATKPPCIVFLHGFGGALTLYMRAIVESEIGKRFVVVAPALDNVGAWRESRALDVVERLVVEQLPPEVDRSRVYLVGLSNGAVGATAALMRARLRTLFAGVALVSGIGNVDARIGLEGTRALVIAGARDPRFPLEGVKARSEALRSAGAEVEIASLDADHYLLLTHAEEWTSRFLAWTGSL